MSDAKNIEKVVQALKKVPEKKLLIIELANTIPIKNGALDIEVLKERQPEINLAIAEATMYGANTMRAVDALSRIRSGKKV